MCWAITCASVSDSDVPRSSGNYRRLTGKLRMNGHSPMLEADNNRILSLVTSDDLRDFDGHTVIVEGILSGESRLRVEWIGRPSQ